MGDLIPWEMGLCPDCGMAVCQCDEEEEVCWDCGDPCCWGDCYDRDGEYWDDDDNDDEMEKS